MSRERIENLKDLLGPHIKDKQIVDCKISRLTAPGENYGGLLLKVNVILKDTKGVQEELNVVAKCIPVNEFMQKIFNIQVTCKNEIAFYDTIVPLIREFEREQGLEEVIDFFPKLYGARINLNGSDVVDENAAIIMENLVESGYKNVDRLVGFDLETAKLIIKDLAAFHATPLALRLAKPEVFEQKIKPYLTHFREPPPPPSSDSGEKPRTPDTVLLEFFETCEEIRPFIPKIKELMSKHFEPRESDTPFSTVVHRDVWVNNIMVKFEDSKPVGNKFVDFQNICFQSPAADLLFFLWSSIQQSVLEENFDFLIEFYHENFIENLKQLHCDITAFSFEKFLEELRTESEFVLGQALFMITFVVFAKEGGFSIEEESLDFGSAEDISDKARERVIYMIKCYNERGWLN